MISNTIKIACISLTITLSSCRFIVKDSILELSEKGVEKGILKSSEKFSSKISEEILEKSLKEFSREIPTGRKALEVISSDIKGKYFPKINNLGKNGLNFTTDYNKLLLHERRKAVSPYMQFLTNDNISKIRTEKLLLGLPASGSTLEKNMLSSMSDDAAKIANAFGGKEAHHIIEGTDALATKSRKILESFNIDINHPINGIFLPQDKNSIYKGTLHKTSHTSEYSEYVYNSIKGAKTKDDLIKALEKIKYELYNGKLKLEGALHKINKNDINI